MSGIFRIPSIPWDELYTTTVSHKYHRSALFKNTSQTKSFHLSPQDTTTSPAAVSCNDTRLPGKLDPPTVAHNALNTYPRPLWPIANRQHCPIVTRVSPANYIKVCIRVFPANYIKVYEYILLIILRYVFEYFLLIILRYTSIS